MENMKNNIDIERKEIKQENFFDLINKVHSLGGRTRDIVPQELIASINERQKLKNDKNLSKEEEKKLLEFKKEGSSIIKRWIEEKENKKSRKDPFALADRVRSLGGRTRDIITQKLIASINQLKHLGDRKDLPEEKKKNLLELEERVSNILEEWIEEKRPKKTLETWANKVFLKDPESLKNFLERAEIKNEKIIFKGDLSFPALSIEQFPEKPEIEVKGSLFVAGGLIRELPKNLKVEGDLILVGTKIETLPVGLEVKGDISFGSKISREKIETLIKEEKIKIKGKINN